MKREEIIQAIAEDKMMPFIQPGQLAQIVDFVIENYQQPAEWREEDERRIVELKTFIAQCNGFNKENQKKAFDMIDAIRHQQRWKPSEEQIQALTVAIYEAARCEDPWWRDSLHDVLLSLHTDL